jgi:amino acid transporter
VALSLIAALYLGLQFVAQGILGPTLATAGDAPLGAAALVAFGPIGATIILIATILSTSGSLAGDALNTPRVIFALGRDGVLPRVLGEVHAEYSTPSVAIVGYAVVCAALALSGTFRALATLGSSGTLCIYLICCTGVLRLRKRGVREEHAPFVVPGGPIVPILATITVLLLLTALERWDFVMLGGLLVVSGVAASLRRDRSGEAGAPAAPL